MIDRLIARARKLLLILRVPAYRRALRAGVAAATEHHHDLSGQTFETVIDVGANRGQFALVARHRWPTARLVCFEPLPGSFGLLEQVVGSQPGVELVNLAVSSQPGTATMHVSAADDSSSLLPITRRQTEAFPGTEERETIEVGLTTLDAFFAAGLSGPVLLKIDVQGFELEVLRGAEATLGAVAAVLVECSFVEFYAGQPPLDDVVRFMHDRGFWIAGASAPSPDARGQVLQLDLMFLRAR